MNPAAFIDRLQALDVGHVQAVLASDPLVLRHWISERAIAGHERRTVFVSLPGDGSIPEAARLAQDLCAMVHATWPIWFGDVDLSWYRDDAAGNARLVSELGRLRSAVPALSSTWAARAVRTAWHAQKSRQARELPGDASVRVKNTCHLLSPVGVNVVVGLGGPFALRPVMRAIDAIEWLARHVSGGVIAAFPADWPHAPPLERLLFRAWTLTEEYMPGDPRSHPPGPVARASGPLAALGIDRVQGQPHPLSEVERRVHAHLMADEELRSIFRFNQRVSTCHGSRPRVDLVWERGGLVVELDGYADHGTSAAFENDRHRDWQLLMSGYRVLRIPNAEVLRDCEAAVAKIRDTVRLVRSEKGI